MIPPDPSGKKTEVANQAIWEKAKLNPFRDWHPGGSGPPSGGRRSSGRAASSRIASSAPLPTLGIIPGWRTPSLSTRCSWPGSPSPRGPPRGQPPGPQRPGGQAQPAPLPAAPPWGRHRSGVLGESVGISMDSGTSLKAIKQLIGQTPLTVTRTGISQVAVTEPNCHIQWFPKADKSHASDAPGLPRGRLIEPKVFPDQRGHFLEIFQARRYPEYGMPSTFVQDNISFSLRGVVRGLHYQLHFPQSKLIMPLIGEIWDVVVDIRRGSPTFGKWISSALLPSLAGNSMCHQVSPMALR